MYFIQPVDGQGVGRTTSGMGLRQEAYQARMHSMSSREEPNLANQAAASSLKGWLKRSSGSSGPDAIQRTLSAPSSSVSRWGGREGGSGLGHKRPSSAVEEDSDDEEPEDDVK